MKVFITVTEEPAFINPFLKSVIKAIPTEIVGIAIVRGSIISLKKGRNKASYLLTIALIMNPLRLLRTASTVISFRFLHMLRHIGIKNPLSLTSTAEKYNIPVIHVSDVNSADFIDLLRQKEIDVIINQAQTILKKDFIAVPKIGCLNRHGALLPKYRGRLAPFWAYLNREKETGVSIHFVEEKLDSGPILVQKRIKIGRFATFDGLVDKVFAMAPQAMLEALEIIRSGRYKEALINNDDELASYYSSPKLSDAFKYRLVMFRSMLYGK
jgi:methionyl-tRNA formyltransferase